MSARPNDRDAAAEVVSADVDGRTPSTSPDVEHPDTHPDTASTAAKPRRHRVLKLSAVALALLVAGVAWSEHAGWPYVAEPAQRWLSRTLERDIRFADGQQRIGWNGRPDVSLHLLGGIRLRAEQLTIANAAWAPKEAGPMVDGRQLALDLRWRDLLAWRPGDTLPLQRVAADDLALDLRRQTARDGSVVANWSLGKADATADADPRPTVDGVRVGRLSVAAGRLVYDDTPLDLHAAGSFGLQESRATIGGTAASAAADGPSTDRRRAQAPAGASSAASAPGGSPASDPLPPGARQTTASSASADAPDAPDGLHADLKGRYQGHALTLTLRTGSTRPWWDASAAADPVTVKLDARAGPARLDFDGRVIDGLATLGLQGRYRIEGRSLAALGEPLGVVLPTTGAVRLDGTLDRDGPRWHTVVSDARVGSSRLTGDLTFVQADASTRQAARARQAAAASGERIAAVTPPPDAGAASAAATDAQAATPTTTAAARADDTPVDRLQDDVPRPRPRLTGRIAASRLLLADLGQTIGAPSPQAPDTPAGQRVLPDKRLDIPSLRAMDADVRFNVRELDTGTDVLQQIKPLQARLTLQSGVLTLSDIDARAARGRLSGEMRLDGRTDNPAWRARLALQGLELAQWVRPLQRADGPPWASGRVDARVWLDGRGRSVADVLGGADGQAALLWRQGEISHLAVEAAGLDVAQGIGVLLFKRNENLSVQCGVARLDVKNGTFTPDPLVVDTRDTRLRVDGSGSLKNETLDLRLVARPKDFSPLTLRSPVHVSGRFNAPDVRVESGPIAVRLLAAAAAAVAVAPVAALLPLVDLPDAKAQAPAACELPALVLQR